MCCLCFNVGPIGRSIIWCFSFAVVTILFIIVLISLCGPQYRFVPIIPADLHAGDSIWVDNNHCEKILSITAMGGYYQQADYWIMISQSDRLIIVPSNKLMHRCIDNWEMCRTLFMNEMEQVVP